MTTIRDAAPEDENAWRRLWAAYVAFYRVAVHEEVTAATWERVLDPATPIIARLAEQNGAVVGFKLGVLHAGTWVTQPRATIVCRAEVRDLALSLARERYADFGPTLAAKKLAELHGCAVSWETLRGWMITDGLWIDRRHRLPSPHQPRITRKWFKKPMKIIMRSNAITKEAQAALVCSPARRMVNSLANKPNGGAPVMSVACCATGSISAPPRLSMHVT